MRGFLILLRAMLCIVIVCPQVSVANDNPQWRASGVLVPVVGLRNPTPPMPGPEPYQPPCDPNSGCCPTQDAAGAAGGYALPYRNKEAAKEAAMAAQLEQTNELLRAIQAQIAAKANQPPTTVAPPPPVKEETKEDEASKMKTAVGRLADKEASWLAEHGGPISSRLAANAEENMDSDSAAVRFKGFTQAKVALLVFCAAIIGVLLLGVAVIHKINNKLIPKLQEMAAKTPGTLDDKAVELLAKIHGRVDTVEEKLKTQFPKLAELQSKADEAMAKAGAALHVGTAAALAAPAGPAASLAAGAAAAAANPPA